jgi:hypothetical protein
MPRPAIRRFNRPGFGQEAAMRPPANLRRLGLGLLIAAGCVALVVAVARHRGSSPESSQRLTDDAVSAVRGVPQAGVFLGSAKAPGHLVVYADLASLRYAEFQDKVLPSLVDRYVKPGRLRLQFASAVSTTGNASDDTDARQAALLAQAAGLQNHLWEFAGAFSAQYVGVLDDATQAQILRSVPGLDRARALSDRRDPRVMAAVERNTVAGQVADARGGLALMLDVNRGAMQQIPVVDDASAQLESIGEKVSGLAARPGRAPGEHAPTAATAPAAAPPARPCARVNTTGSTIAVACTTASARLTIVPQRLELPLPGVRARLLSVETVPATSPSGRARNRLRVVVRLRIQNRGDKPIFGGETGKFIYLSLGTRHIAEDHHVWTQTGAFRQNKPIAPGASRTGIMHFELAGKDTIRLRQRGGGQLGIRPTETPNDQGKVPVGVIRFSTG